MSQIKVNAAQWNSISEQEQQEIIEALRHTGSIREEDTVLPDEDTEPFTEDTMLEPMWNPIKDVCKALCDTTAAAAVTWCTANTAGVGLAACLALAESARQECRRRC